ncbi:unnamed protein product [Caenorhabditis brenneri]
MLRFYEISDAFTKFGVASVTIVNTFFIFLTVFHVKRIVGTYKKMVLIFAISGIIFSSWELIARPFVHNFNKGWIFFSLNKWLGVSKKLLQLALIIYASFYLFMVVFIAVQFLFRYYTLVNPRIAKKFTGKGIYLWMTYSLLSGVIYGGMLFLFGGPDDYSDEYMREEILQTYGSAVKELPRIQMIPYAADGSLRIGNVLFIVIGSIDMTIQYSIIIYCDIRMHLVMKKEIDKSSIPNKKLQKQFFRALIVQTIVPTVLFVFPAAVVLMNPLLDIEMSFQTGWIYAFLSLYPPIDTIAFMILVSEYRKVIKELYKVIFPDKPNRSSETELSSTVGKI